MLVLNLALALVTQAVFIGEVRLLREAEVANYPLKTISKAASTVGSLLKSTNTNLSGSKEELLRMGFGVETIRMIECLSGLTLHALELLFLWCQNRLLMILYLC